VFAGDYPGGFRKFSVGENFIKVTASEMLDPA
jgi:hypothetical protein